MKADSETDINGFATIIKHYKQLLTKIVNLVIHSSLESIKEILS